jgi:hypothetical protein
MQKRCKNCRYWKDSPIGGEPSRFCRNRSFRVAFHDLDDDDVVVPGLTDDGNEPAFIATCPEFGCVHFRVVKGDTNA